LKRDAGALTALAEGATPGPLEIAAVRRVSGTQNSVRDKAQRRSARVKASMCCELSLKQNSRKKSRWHAKNWKMREVI